MAKPSKKFDAAEFLGTMERMAGGLDYGEIPVQRPVDPKLHREVVASFVQGRHIEVYKQVLEYYGFTYFPADKCPTMSNGQKPTEAQWRSLKHRLAFTEQEVMAHFPKGPEEFDTWMREQIGRRRAAAASLLSRR